MERPNSLPESAHTKASALNKAVEKGEIKAEDLDKMNNYKFGRIEIKKTLEYIEESSDEKLIKEDEDIIAERFPEYQKIVKESLEEIDDANSHIEKTIQEYQDKDIKDIEVQDKRMVDNINYIDNEKKSLLSKKEEIRKLKEELKVEEDRVSGEKRKISEEHNNLLMDYMSFFRSKNPNLLQKIRFNFSKKYSDEINSQRFEKMSELLQEKKLLEQGLEEKRNKVLSFEEELNKCQISDKEKENLLGLVDDIESEINSSHDLKSKIAKTMGLAVLEKKIEDNLALFDNYSDLDSKIRSYEILERIRLITGSEKNKENKAINFIKDHLKNYINSIWEEYISKTYLNEVKYLIMEEKSKVDVGMVDSKYLGVGLNLKIPVIDPKTTWKEDVSYNLLHVPTREEFLKMRKSLDLIEETDKTGYSTYDLKKIQETLLESRLRREDHVDSLENMVVTHASSKKNSISILEQGEIRSEVNAKDVKNTEVFNSPQGEIVENESIAFSIYGSETQYLKNYKVESREKLKETGLMFIFPFEKVAKDNKWFELKNTQHTGGRKPEELHILNKSGEKGVSIDNAVIFVKKRDEDYWKNKISSFGYDESWINSHIIFYDSFDKIDKEVIKNSSEARKKLRKLSEEKETDKNSEFKLSQKGFYKDHRVQQIKSAGGLLGVLGVDGKRETPQSHPDHFREIVYFHPLFTLEEK